MLFELGAEYKRDDMLRFVGSRQAESGIVWGPKEPGCVLVTSGGKHSDNAGYLDKRNPDRTWDYFGQGEQGDQDPSRYANKLLVDKERTVLRFSTREPTVAEKRERGDYSKRYRYEGAFGVRTWEWFTPQSGRRAGNKLLLFHLLPVTVLDRHPYVTEQYAPDPGVGLQQLRSALLEQSGRPTLGCLSASEYRRASAGIRQYARLRANGICERCSTPAPFADSMGIPFLEVHHIHRLADDGPDIPRNVAALCPNCHREAHCGQQAQQIRRALSATILPKERALSEN